ncbi:Prolyl oligopeptidase family protein [Pseudoxanthomonas sp. GM95]|uniref:carboxylesterase family protein n=1 Tax=Pseudoxanthomonas sp. GM95 TaxID=1881043 RepID=UPI0008CD6315|nr:prolyl oligopeptidase family serine peptidase [Pseudoxanthomonas sp. GM95]SEL75696.1 Prolyl oligopeptidase family protein [Pseudoxanthomonas sp. GM95]
MRRLLEKLQRRVSRLRHPRQAEHTAPLGPVPACFVERSVQLDGVAHRYRVFVPCPTALEDAPALVLFLHGSGERGTDNRGQLDAGLGAYLQQQAHDFPALVVLPQVPGVEEWTGTNARVALAALAATLDEFAADPARVYATGMSMGGYGTWEVALMAPARFAALVPVCGAVHPPRRKRPSLRITQVDGTADPYAAIAARLADMPVWMFHGARDDRVPVEDDRRLVQAFAAAGHPVRYTEYPDADHNIWDATYADPALWAWLFAQRRH